MKNAKVMVSVITLLLVSCLASFANALICSEDNQYLNNKLQRCLECTKCPNGYIVIAPCELHRDTICGPEQEFLRSVDENRHRHKHNRHRGHNNHGENSIKSRNEPTSMGVQMSLDADAPFTSTEALVWDWQAVALTLAVFSCILFFIVITLYSLHQARQWKRLKETFEADVEELSAKLSLMAASSNEKDGIQEDDFRQNHTTESDYSNRCVYLEQLLYVRKDEKLGKKPKGNVYIEESI